MSIATIDATTYKQIFGETVARYLKNGYSLLDARNAACQLMNSCFACDDAVQQWEVQKDFADTKAGDWTK